RPGRRPRSGKPGMRRGRGWAAALAVAAALAATAPACAADIAAGAAAVRDRALADGTAWSLVESLTTEIRARPTGSPAMVRARDWAARKLRVLGFENVRVEPFEAEAWLRGAEQAEVVSPFPRPLHVLGLGRSVSTPRQGLEAEIVLFRTFDELVAAPPG